MMDSKLDAYAALKDNPDALIKVLHYHVVPQKIGEADIKNEMFVQSMSSEQLRFNIYGDVILPFVSSCCIIKYVNIFKFN